MSRLTQLIVVAFAASYWVLAEAGVEVEVLKKGESMPRQLRGVCEVAVECPGMTTRSAAFFQRLHSCPAHFVALFASVLL